MRRVDFLMTGGDGQTPRVSFPRKMRITEIILRMGAKSKYQETRRRAIACQPTMP